MSIASGRPPGFLLGESDRAVFDRGDLEVLAQWKRATAMLCPGCGRPVWQHLNNPRLGRGEEPGDYTPWSFECPAAQALSDGQGRWRRTVKAAQKRFDEGNGPDPGAGLYWVAQGPGEPEPYDSEGVA